MPGAMRRRRLLAFSQQAGTIPRLSGFAAYARASRYGGAGLWLDERGHGHHATAGATPAAESDDPLWLDYGSTKYLRLPGISGNYASTPDHADFDITGDLDIRCAVALDDWTSPGNASSLVAKQTTTGNQRAYALRIAQTTGLVILARSTSGSSGTVITATSTAAPTVAASALLLIRATLDLDNGAGASTVTFSTKTATEATAHAALLLDTGWTQLGDPVITAGTTATFSSTATVGIGAETNGTTSILPGNWYAAVIKSGIAGTTVLDVDFGAATAPYATLLEAGGKTVTLNRVSDNRMSRLIDRDAWTFGLDDYLWVPTSPELSPITGPFTLVVHTRRYGTPGASEVLVAKKANLSGGRGYALYVDTSSRAVGVVADGSGSVTVTSTALSDGVDHMIAIVADRSAQLLRMYVDGVADGTADISGVGSVENTEDLRIGRLSGAATSYANLEIFAWAFGKLPRSAADVALDGTALAVP